MPPPPPSAISEAVATEDNATVVDYETLTALGVTERRAKSIFKGGLAAAGFSEAFKGKQVFLTLPNFEQLSLLFSYLDSNMANNRQFVRMEINPNRRISLVRKLRSVRYQCIPN